MKFSIFLSKGLLLFSLLIMSQISFGQNPVVINDSLVVKQRLYAREKLIVDKDATFKQAVSVTGNLTSAGATRFSGTLEVVGGTKMNGTVTMSGIGNSGTLTPTSQVVIVAANGAVQKGTIGGLFLAMSAAPASLDYCGANGGIPQWWAGTNKLFTACNNVNVGIRNDSPQFPLHVSGTATSTKFLCGNSGGSTDAVMNIFAQNDSQDLLRLGMKIGSLAEEVRFKVKNDGTVYAKELRIRMVSEFPDYVFEDNYALMSLSELSEFIKNNKHLPNMPTASEVNKAGLAIGDVVVRLVEKVEELTLYTIQLKEENDLLKNELDQMKKDIEEIKKSLN